MIVKAIVQANTEALLEGNDHLKKGQDGIMDMAQQIMVGEKEDIR